jgi:hypothetical protein
MANKKFKNYYFLFGGEICGIAENYGVDAAIEAAKNGVDFHTYHWDEYSSPVELLGDYNGNEEFITLTEEQYEKFLAIPTE